MTAAIASEVADEQEQAAGNSVEVLGDTDTEDIRILYLFSGPHRPDDGLTKFLQELGAECVCVDKEFNNDHDLLDQNFWENCKEEFEEYDGFMISHHAALSHLREEGMGARNRSGAPMVLTGTGSNFGTIREEAGH